MASLPSIVISNLLKHSYVMTVKYCSIFMLQSEGNIQRAPHSWWHLRLATPTLMIDELSCRLSSRMRYIPLPRWCPRLSPRLHRAARAKHRWWHWATPHVLKVFRIWLFCRDVRRLQAAINIGQCWWKGIDDNLDTYLKNSYSAREVDAAQEPQHERKRDMVTAGSNGVEQLFWKHGILYREALYSDSEGVGN